MAQTFKDLSDQAFSAIDFLPGSSWAPLAEPVPSGSIHRLRMKAGSRIPPHTHLPEILRLYAQPDLDDGKVLPLSEAERIFERMARYPDYTIYVAVCNDQTVGVRATDHGEPGSFGNALGCHR